MLLTFRASIAACRSEIRGQCLPFRWARLQAHLERIGADGDAGVARQTGQRFTFRHADIERVQQRREKEEELHPGEHLPQTHPPPNTEGQKVFRFGDFSLRVYETRGVELFGFLPEVGVHVDGVEERHHLGVLGKVVTVQFEVPANDGERLHKRIHTLHEQQSCVLD